MSAGAEKGMSLMKNRLYKCGVSLLLAACLLLPGSPLVFAEPARPDVADNSIVLNLAKEYNDYLAGHAGAPEAGATLHIGGGDFFGSDYQPEMLTDHLGKEGRSVLTRDSGYVEWEVVVEEEGFYNLAVDYLPTGKKSGTIVRSLYIDGQLPFNEARMLMFQRLWTDEKNDRGEAVQQDVRGNDIRPTAVELPEWRTAPLIDASGFVTALLEFYFSKGKHTLRLTAIQEPMIIHRITLFRYENPAPYSRIKSEYDGQGYKEAAAAPIKIQAETPASKSDPTIVPVSDRSSPSLEPSSPSHLRLNTIGSTGNATVGQFVTWEFDVANEGLYKIGLKVKQDFVSGANSYRSIAIDGTVPFEELDGYCFNYARGYKMHVLGGENDPYQFHFAAGTHTITFQNTLGKMAETLQTANQILKELNTIFTEILVITGPLPDVNRDYEFGSVIPDTLENMKLQSRRLKDLYDKMVAEAQTSGYNMQLLVQLYTQLDAMIKNPYSIASRFAAFNMNIDLFGSWINEAKQQPLSIDYLVVAPLSAEMPKANTGFFSNLTYQVRSFLSSFFVDYNVIAGEASDKQVEVWVGSGLTGGRDQAQILKMLSDDRFMPSMGIAVNLKLVSVGALLPAVLAGKGPDAALSVDSGEAANYAFRKAAYNLSRFDDFGEVAKRFSPSAMVPLSFDGLVYGLPETQTFPMLFYRKDILLQLGIDKIPETWDDVINMLPILQQHQLNFSLPNVIGTAGNIMPLFTMMLMQNGLNLYSEDAKKTTLNSQEAIQVFDFIYSLYLEYQIPQEVDFLNRFRKGITPIGIADYSFYNQISVFAPEISGLWDFKRVPGVVGADGTVNFAAPANINACVMMSNAKNPEYTWEFMKWWTSGDVQTDFGRQLESIMGTAARYPTANLEALEQIPWSPESYDSLMHQWHSVQGVPEVPGGYFLPRYANFAYRDITMSAADVGEALTTAANIVNNEIFRKRIEFGLPN